MKVITLTQPWATLVAIGAKKIETRSWNTTYRGPLAIHAAVGKYVDDYLLMKVEPFYSALRNAGIESRLQIPLGGIIATCELVHVKQMDELQVFPACRGIGYKQQYWKLDAKERAFGHYEVGRYMWLLSNVKKLDKPIAAKGALGLWNFDMPTLED